jgi:predicted nucleotidyltransferase
MKENVSPFEVFNAKTHYTYSDEDFSSEFNEFWEKIYFKYGYILGVTIAGSQAWKMDHPNSDKDYYILYAGNIEDILIGNSKRFDGGVMKTVQGAPEQFTAYEIGFVVNQLKKGNVNHLWGILSPELIITAPIFDDLKKLVASNIGKNCFNSINGLARHNLKLWFSREKDRRELFNYKKLNIIGRTILFGINLLKGQVDFLPTSYTKVSDVEQLLDELQVAYDISELPLIPNEEWFNDFLLNVRETQLKNAHLL